MKHTDYFGTFCINWDCIDAIHTVYRINFTAQVVESTSTIACVNLIWAFCQYSVLLPLVKVYDLKYTLSTQKIYRCLVNYKIKCYSWKWLFRIICSLKSSWGIRYYADHEVWFWKQWFLFGSGRHVYVKRSVWLWQLFEDTLKAGHYENDQKSVEIMIKSSPDVVKDLVRMWECMNIRLS